MAQVIKLKRSSVLGKTPQTSSLELGELAINTRDGKIYFHRSGSGDDSIQSVFTTDATITGSLKLSGSQHISGSTNIMDNLTYGGDLSASLGSTSSFDRFISAGTSSVGYLIASGSNIVTTPDLTGSFASGSDVQGILDTYASGSDLQVILAESASYVVSTNTGSFASGSDLHQFFIESSSYVVESETGSFASGSDVQTILDDYAKGTEISGSYLGLLSSSNDLTLGGGISGSIVSTASFGAYVGDGSQLTGINAAVNTYTNSGNNRIITSVDSTSINAEQNLTFDGTLLSGSATTTASFGKFVGDGSSLSGVQIETGSFASGSDVQTILDTYASGSDVQTIKDTYASGSDLQVILAESASYVVSTNTGSFASGSDLHQFFIESSSYVVESETGSFASGSDLQVILAESASYLTNNTTSSFGAVTMNETLFVQGDITTSGSVIAREFKTEFVSSSIIYSSGSSQFGDTIDDIHRFTGSLELTGSQTIDGEESFINYTTDGVSRWQVGKNSADDFKINRFDGGGSFLDQPLSIASSSGITTILDELTRSGGVTRLIGGGSTQDGVGVYNDMKVGIGTGTTAIGDEKLKVDGDVGITGSLFVSSSITTPTTASLGKIILSDNVHTTPFASGSDVQTIKDTYASGSDVQVLKDQVLGFATGSDLHQFFIESSSYVVESETGSFASGSDVQTILDTYASGSDVQGILDTYASGSDVQGILDDYAKRTEISGSFNQGFEFTGTISGSITSTGSFGKLLGDASELSNLPESFTSAMISGSFQGGGSTLISGSITSTGSFGYVKVSDGTDFVLYKSSEHAIIENQQQDRDIFFRINDGGTAKDTLMIRGAENNVGINNSVPSKKLTVGGDISGSGTLFIGTIKQENSSDASGDVTITPDGTLNLGTASTDNILIGRTDLKTNNATTTMQMGGANALTILHGKVVSGNSVTSSAQLTVAGDVSASGDLFIDDISTTGTFTNTSGTLKVSQSVSDGDIEISVNDGGTTTKALTIDGSDAGTFILGNNLRMADNQKIRLGTSNDFNLYHDGSNSYLYNETTGGKIIIQNNAFDSDIEIKVSDSGSLVNAIIIDASEAGDVLLPNDNQSLKVGAGGDLRLIHNGTNSFLENSTSNGGHLYISNRAQDKSIFLRVDEGGTEFNAVTIDGAQGGKAIFVGGVSSSLGQTGSFDRLEGVTLNASISPFASGSDVSGLLSATGSYASGSDVSQILIESASYLVDADTGSLGLVTLTSDITGSITSTGSFGSILTSGNVGIGIASPGAKMHIQNGASGFASSYNSRTNAVIEGSSAFGSVLSIMSKNTGYSGIFFGDQDSESIGQFVYDHTDNKFKFKTSGGVYTPLTLDGSGNVGIGTANPNNDKLLVAGNTGITGDLYVSGSITAEEYIVKSSVINVTQSFSSGSTIFGDSIDDTHKFTGSIEVSSSIRLQGDNSKFFLSTASGDYWTHIGAHRPKLVTANVERFRVASAGHVIFNEEGNDMDFRIESVSDINAFKVDASTNTLAIGSEPDNVSKLKVAGDVGITGSLFVSSSITSPGGITIDNITIDGTEIDLSSGDLTLDVAGDIDLDAGGQQIKFSTGGTAVGQIDMAGTDLEIKSLVSDATFTLRGNDGGSEIDMLAFDVAGGGNATFLANVSSSITSTGSFGALSIGHGTPDRPLRVYAQAADSNVARFSHGSANSAVDIYTGTSGGLINVRNGSGTSTINIDARNDRINLVDSIKSTYGTGNDLEIYHDGTNSVINHAGTGNLQIYQNQDDQDIVLLCDDGAGGVTDYIRLDGSATNIKVSKTIKLYDGVNLSIGDSDDLILKHDGINTKITNSTGDLIVSQSAQDKNFAISINDGGTTKTAFFIDGATGYVGIGETSLVKQFQVNGTITITNNGGYTQRDNVGNIATILNLNSSNLLTVGDNNHADNLKIQNSSFNHIYFNSVGNIGIGTSSPSQRLHVYDTGSNLQFYLQSGADQATMRFDNNTASYVVGINSAEQYQWYSSALGQNAGFISSNGNLYWNYTFLLSNNNKFIQGRDTAGQTRNMLGMNSANNIQLGDSSHTGSMVVNTPLLTGSLASTASFGAFIGDGSQLTGITASPDATLVSGSFEGGGSNNISGSLASTGSFGQLIVQKEGSSGMPYSSYNFRNTAIFEGSNASGATIAISAKNTGYSGIFFGDQDSSTQGQLQFDHTTNKFKFVEGGVDMMEIDTSGNVTVSDGDMYVSSSIPVLYFVDSDTGDTNGFQNYDGSLRIIADKNTGHGGSNINFRVDGAGDTSEVARFNNKGLVINVGSQGTTQMDENFLVNGDAGITGSLTISGSLLPGADNTTDIGSASKRFQDVFAVQTTVGAVFETGLRSEGIGKEETGTIVVWRNGGLVPCDTSEDTMVMGVVKQGKDEPIVMGAEPVLVTGDVKEGDFITTSTKLGHGKKIESGYLLRKEMFGKVIAQALENATGESSLIKCMIRKM